MDVDCLIINAMSQTVFNAIRDVETKAEGLAAALKALQSAATSDGRPRLARCAASLAVGIQNYDMVIGDALADEAREGHPIPEDSPVADAAVLDQPKEPASPDGPPGQPAIALDGSHEPVTEETSNG